MYYESMCRLHNPDRIIRNKSTFITEIIDYMFVSKADFQNFINDIYSNDNIAHIVMADLVLFFHEINKHRIGICRFDKEIFNLPEIKKIRQYIKNNVPDRINQSNIIDNAQYINNAITHIENNLNPDIKKKIYDSFVKRITSIYIKCYKKFSKAVSLAISDYEDR